MQNVDGRTDGQRDTVITIGHPQRTTYDKGLIWPLNINRKLTFEFDKTKCIFQLLIFSSLKIWQNYVTSDQYDVIQARAKHVGFGKMEEFCRFLNIQRQKLE